MNDDSLTLFVFVLHTAMVSTPAARKIYCTSFFLRGWNNVNNQQNSWGMPAPPAPPTMAARKYSPTYPNL